MSASERVEPDSSSFSQLDERIQRWIWSAGWTVMRDIQEKAIPALVNADRDVIIAAATASGKTEAAFFPILTNFLKNGSEGCVIYISPLKALINDQWERLDQLCENLEIPVTPWHGDVAANRKARFIKKPYGVLLITPESLEALFVNRGHSVPTLFKSLRYVVIDELHAFIGSERGKQLQSLLHRLELAADHPVPRVGLSATLGDMALASTFMRPEKSEQTQLIVSQNAHQELKLIIKGYVDKPLKPRADSEAEISDVSREETSTSLNAIADHLYRVLRGTNNLVFPNSRGAVETYADLLRRRCENERVPNEFWPHHGSLSKNIREETEQALKAGDKPATAICTTTLELGIDIGGVKSIAQIGSPPSVASLRQRLGRSGRRAGESSILRCYCVEHELTSESPLSDRLHEGLIQSTAMLQLLLAGWCEPPHPQGLHASTLVQQLLSLIAQYGGITSKKAWESLIGGSVFSNIIKEDFVGLLKTLIERDLIYQDKTGLLLLGERGERMVSHYDFYAAFMSEDEYRLSYNGSTLGALPISKPLLPEQNVIFAGRRWQVISVDSTDRVIVVAPSVGGKPPLFDGAGIMVHDRIRQEMRAVLDGNDIPAFLDPAAKMLLVEAREAYEEMDLTKGLYTREGKNLILMNWCGDWTNNALAMFLTALGCPATNEGMILRLTAESINSIAPFLDRIAKSSQEELLAFVGKAKNLQCEKWDWALPTDLLVKSFASTRLDVSGAQREAARLLNS